MSILTAVTEETGIHKAHFSQDPHIVAEPTHSTRMCQNYFSEVLTVKNVQDVYVALCTNCFIALKTILLN